MKKGPPFDSAQLASIGAMLGRPPAEIPLQGWADLVDREWMKKKMHVRTGMVLHVAKRIVPHGQWGRLFQKHPQAVARPLLMSDRTAERLIRLGRHSTLPRLLLNSTHGSKLPTSWRTLAELSRFAPSAVEQLVALGRLHSKTKRAEVSWWIARWHAQQLQHTTERGAQQTLASTTGAGQAIS